MKEATNQPDRPLKLTRVVVVGVYTAEVGEVIVVLCNQRRKCAEKVHIRQLWIWIFSFQGISKHYP
jgi:hypothetical protein